MSITFQSTMNGDESEQGRLHHYAALTTNNKQRTWAESEQLSRVQNELVREQWTTPKDTKPRS